MRDLLGDEFIQVTANPYSLRPGFRELLLRRKSDQPILVATPDFVFCRHGRVHLNRRGRQFSRLLAAEVCASALVMLDTPRSEVVTEYWLPTPFASFPFTSPPMRHRVPSGFKRTLRI